MMGSLAETGPARACCHFEKGHEEFILRVQFAMMMVRLCSWDGEDVRYGVGKIGA